MQGDPNLSLFDKRVLILNSLLLRISKLRSDEDKIRFSKLIGGLIVFFQSELGDPL